MDPDLAPEGVSPGFTAGRRTYDLAQVISAADWRGELVPFRQRSRVRARLAVLARERELEVDEAAVEELAGDYRYGRDLTTAAECEAWLAGRGLSVEEFQEYCLRLYWEKQLAGKDGNRDVSAGADTAEVDEWFRVDLLFSQEFDRQARQLAWRVALNHEQAATSPAAEADAVGDWPEELRRMEAGFQARCGELLTAENQRRCLANLRLPLTRFELDVLEVDGDLAGREAYLCVTQDGMSLGEVAAESRYALTNTSTLLEDLPAEWQPVLLSAPIGTVLPPFGTGEERFLCFVKGKQDASLDRAEVLARVNRTLLRQHFLELEARHVQWHILLDVSA